MAILADASAPSLHHFVADNVDPGALVITDGWSGYQGIETLGYAHEARSQRAARARGEDPGALLPAVHRVASLVKRRLLGTHQGSVGDVHLQAYLNEFVLRFNRRHSSSRGLIFFRVLQLAVSHEPGFILVFPRHPMMEANALHAGGHWSAKSFQGGIHLL